MSFEQKSNWLRRNPVTAARHFHYKLNLFFNGFLKSSANPLGEIVDYAIRVEFQARGSPHAHTVIWVKNAPKYGIDSNEKVCNFIDKYISCAVPEDNEQLKELVLTLQNHKHSTYCKKRRGCRFNFPQPPSYNTLISEPNDDDDDTIDTVSNVLSKVRNEQIDNNACVDVSLNELLTKVKISHSNYVDALKTSIRGNVVVLKRKPCECKINNYNPHVMLAWQANMDLQYVMNPYACIMYVASYMMKTEKAMGELLRSVANENRSEELKTQLKKVGSAFLNHREVSAQEAVYRILSLPMTQLSRSVVFVDTNPSHEQVGVLKSFKEIPELDDDDQNILRTYWKDMSIGHIL